MQKGRKNRTLLLVFALAWPTMLEQLMQTAVQYIDVAMIGTLGTAATAAVGATTTVNWLVGSTISALGVGFLSFIAKACGAGDREKAARASSQAVLMVLLCGALFTALTLGCSQWVPMWMQVDPHIQTLAGQYFFILYTPMLFRTATTIFGTALRAAGDTKTPMRVGVLVNLANVVLNFLLIYPTRSITVGDLVVPIYGAGLGVLGAAAASAVAFTLGGVCITVALWRHPLLSPRGQSLRPDAAVLLPCLRVALPNMLQRFGTSLGYVAFAGMINALGEVATAAHTVANTVESAFYIPGYGMQTAAATLAGNAVGANDRRYMRSVTRTVLIAETVLMCLSGGLLFLLAPTLLHLFSDNPAVISLSTTVLRTVAVSEPIFGIAIILEGVMLGVGCTVMPFVFNISGMWGVRIVGTFLCTRFFGGGLIAAWGCMVAHNLLLFFLFLVHYFRGKWNPLENEKEKITQVA